MFNAANVAVYDEGMKRGGADRMATTLTISLFRRNEVAVGHVGDSRAYLVRQGQIKQLTSDHTYVAMQLKMRADLASRRRRRASCAACSRGASGRIRPCRWTTRARSCTPTTSSSSAATACTAASPRASCATGQRGCRRPRRAQQLVRLAEKRGSEDNISVQIVRVESVPRVGYYRGSVAYFAPPPTPATNEIQVGQILDERFEIAELIHRSGMSSVFKATDLKTGRRRRAEGAAAEPRRRPGVLLAVRARRRDRPHARSPGHPEDSSPIDDEGQEPAVPRHGVPRGPDARRR